MTAEAGGAEIPEMEWLLPAACSAIFRGGLLHQSNGADLCACLCEAF